MVYASLIGLLQLKFQSTKESAFETHGFFMNMSVVAILMFALSYWILDYTSENSSMNRLTSSPTVTLMILVIVALFSVFLAPFSLVLVLFVPPNLMWIVYSSICVLVIAIIAYNSISIHHRTSIGKLSKVVINYIRDRF